MSLASQWAGVKAAFGDSKSNASPGTRFGLMFDPLAYIGGDKYRDFINKTGDQANLSLSKALGTSNKGGWAANKPASTIGLLAAAYYGGGSALSGMGGGGGSSSSGLGIFSNGGRAGLSGLGGGNAGALASQGGISGGAGIGSAQAAPALGAQQYMKMGQQLLGQQQPQQQQAAPAQAATPQHFGPAAPAMVDNTRRRPYLFQGQLVWL